MVENRWIPVIGRLPDRFGEFIVSVKAFDGRVYSDYADYDPFQQRWKTGLHLCPGDKVTHWMELPEPPKEDL